MNAITIESAKGIRLAKEKQSAKIDACAALSFASLAAVQAGRPVSLEREPLRKIVVRTNFDARRLRGYY